MPEVKTFILSILGIAMVLAIGFIVLGQLNQTSGVAPYCQDWKIPYLNGTTVCQHYECINNTLAAGGANYVLNSTLANCYNSTAYGVRNNTQLVSVMPTAYNTTGSIMGNMSAIPNWIGILITVSLAFIVLGYFYKRD
jgi:hypothetical protein